MFRKLMDTIREYFYPSVPPIKTTEMIDSDDNIVITEHNDDDTLTLREFIKKHSKRLELAQCETEK